MQLPVRLQQLTMLRLELTESMIESCQGWHLQASRSDLGRQKKPAIAPAMNSSEPAACQLASKWILSRLVLAAGKRTVHLIVSRTATGSSVRFVAAFAHSYLSSPWGQPAPMDDREKSPLGRSASAHSPAWLAWELGNSSLVRLLRDNELPSWLRACWGCVCSQLPVLPPGPASAHG